MSIIINETSLDGGEIDAFVRPTGAEVSIAEDDLEFKTEQELVDSTLTNANLADVIASLTDKPTKRQSSRKAAAKRIFKLLETTDEVPAEKPKLNNPKTDQKRTPAQVNDHKSEANWDDHVTTFGNVKMREDGYPKARARYVRAQLASGRRDFESIAGECQVLYPKHITGRHHVAWDLFDMKRKHELD